MRICSKTKYMTMLVTTLLLCLFIGRAQASNRNEMLPATITVECAGNTDSVYLVAIENEDEKAPQPLFNELKIKPGGTGEFDLTLNEPGSYHYLVYEKAGAVEGVKYDDRVYRVTVFVTQDDTGRLDYVVTASLKDTGEKPDSISFKNRTESDDNPNDPDNPDNPGGKDTPGGNGDNDNPSGGSNITPGGGSNVKTGDESNIGLLVGIAVAMIVVFVVMIILRKKDDKKDNE